MRSGSSIVTTRAARCISRTRFSIRTTSSRTSAKRAKSARARTADVLLTQDASVRERDAAFDAVARDDERTVVRDAFGGGHERCVRAIEQQTVRRPGELRAPFPGARDVARAFECALAEGGEDCGQQRAAVGSRRAIGEEHGRRIDRGELAIVRGGALHVESDAAADGRALARDARNAEDAAALPVAEQEIVRPLER